MPIIKIETKIKSTSEICFYLSRSIDLHTISTSQTNEKAIAGTISSLIKLNESVTWQAKHFGITQKLTSIISIYKKPVHFRDEQIKGPFKLFIHDHYFKEDGDLVVMKDILEFESPFGIVGLFFNKLTLTNYLTNFLIKRNNIIKEYAESEKWKLMLKN